jgi:hypothetical protein
MRWADRDRHYRRIAREAGLEQAKDVEALIQLLRGYDLKREDAQLLLEAMPGFCAQAAASPAPAEGAPPVPQRREYEDHFTLRSQLAMDRLALKRAALRLGAFQSFVRRGKVEGRPLQAQELEAARRLVFHLQGTFYLDETLRRLAPLGLQREALDAFVGPWASAVALFWIASLHELHPAVRRRSLRAGPAVGA